MSAEEWRPIPGYDGAYEASTEGRIRSLDRMTTGRRAFRIKGRILRPALNPAGYPFVALCRDGVHRSLTVHRLIALTFLGPRPEGLEICHGDGDRTNAALSNLRYDTKSANAYDRCSSRQPPVCKPHSLPQGPRLRRAEHALALGRWP